MIGPGVSWWCGCNLFFFFNDTATTEIYTLSLHDALPILPASTRRSVWRIETYRVGSSGRRNTPAEGIVVGTRRRDRKKHTSELQSRQYLVCRLLLEKKNNPAPHAHSHLHRRPTPINPFLY